MSRTVLVVEDDEILARNVGTFLGRNGWEVEVCGSAEDALKRVETFRPDGVVTDQTLPRMCGIEFIQKLHEAAPLVKCIMMTGDDTAHTAVRAMKAGAVDYLMKPVVMAELHRLLDRAVGAIHMEPTLQFHQHRQAGGTGLNALIGNSPAMRALKRTIEQVLDAERRVAGGDLPAVLIFGETGTGKELVARSMHFDGPRHKGPFVEINCASIPSHLLEAELFGHEKGAFTDAKERKVGLVETAEGGTLFLDEIGEIDHSLQAKLLKLLEEKTVRRIGAVKERKVNLRIISATNRDLEAMVKQGTFRSDLYFRLRIISISVPSLRTRGADILQLARHYLEAHGRHYGKPGLRFSEAAEQVLLQYYWPGNVRELRNSLEQTVLLAPAEVITPGQLVLCPALAPGSDLARHGQVFDPLDIPVRRNGAELAGVDRNMVVKTLERTGWNVTKSAKLLGLSRDMMRYRIEKLGLARPDDADDTDSTFGSTTGFGASTGFGLPDAAG
jgi:two-component system, NtrC family, response regulator AtoC